MVEPLQIGRDVHAGDVFDGGEGEGEVEGQKRGRKKGHRLYVVSVYSSLLIAASIANCR